MMAALCTGVQLNLIAEPFVAFSKAYEPGISKVSTVIYADLKEVDGLMMLIG